MSGVEAWEFATTTARSNTTRKPDSHTKLGAIAQLDEAVTQVKEEETKEKAKLLVKLMQLQR